MDLSNSVESGAGESIGGLESVGGRVESSTGLPACDSTFLKKNIKRVQVQIADQSVSHLLRLAWLGINRDD